MYQNHYKSDNHSGRNGNQFRGRNRFQGRGRRIKKLDPNLFIHKPNLTLNNSESEKSIESRILFSSFPIDDRLKRNISDHGYTIPTAIQEKAIPEILAGRDVIGMANTGTGKTAAFLVSLIHKAYQARSQRALIVVPTRELAVQITDEFKTFARGMGLEALAAIGGTNLRRQLYLLRHNPNFVIGTPGRLKDLVNRGNLNLMLFQNVVLDEVDRMVDIGFIHDINFLISHLPKTRQSLFFSATVDGKTQEILKNFVTNPVTVSVKKQDIALNIEQNIVRVTGAQTKIDVLHELLIRPGFDKVIVFGRTKWGMEKLSRTLSERGFRTAAIHGNKTQNQRQRALDDFRSNRLKILIATDVAARGLDIENVTHVINFDAPETYEEYIHRIGRTGRAGKPGVALTFVE